MIDASPTPVLVADWREADRSYVMARVAEVKARLAEWLSARGDAALAGAPRSGPTPRDAAAIAEGIRARMPAPPALERISSAFSLSRFEESLLLACAAVELDTTIGALCAQANGEPDRKIFTFALAVSVLPEAHWTALTPEGALRRWKLVEVAAGPTLTSAALRIDERVLHCLLGASQVDARLAPLLAPLPETGLLPSQQSVVVAAEAWRNSSGDRYAAIQVYGGDTGLRLEIAGAIARGAGLHPWRLAAHAVPTAPQDLDAFLRLWEREAALDRFCLVLDCPDESDPVRQAALHGVADGLNAPVIFAAAQPLRLSLRPMLSFEAPAANPQEQLDCWSDALGSRGEAMHETLEALSEQFRFSPAAIRTVWEEARPLSQESDAPHAAEILWNIARRHARGSLDELAQRLLAAPDWDDLVLPEPQKNILLQIAAQVSHRAKVHHEWGFDRGGARGLGLGVLFSGPSGTGKTLAAEVLAARLKLDLYRIDLSAVVSKYIGDTERNLRRVFDAAENCGAILLFDEADALFGQRSEVKDSHDRYANIEVSYLLQRMEAYRGLAILTTNRKRALDQAFHRRLRFAVEFPFPDAGQRAEIWKRAFPKRTPVEALDFARLARLEVAGGNIRNIAMNAAFLAASEGRPISMEHLLAAARAEYLKIDRPLTPLEFGGRS